MMGQRQQILESLRRANCIDEELYQIMVSFSDYEKNPSKYTEKMTGLIATGLSEEQFYRITTVGLLLILDFDDVNAYAEEFNGLYKKVKEVFDGKSKG